MDGRTEGGFRRRDEESRGGGTGGQCTVCAAFVGPPKGNGGSVISQLAGFVVVQDEPQIVGGKGSGCVCVCGGGSTR